MFNLEARLLSGSEWFVSRTYKTAKARAIGLERLYENPERRFEYRIPKAEKTDSAT